MNTLDGCVTYKDVDIPIALGIDSSNKRYSQAEVERSTHDRNLSRTVEFGLFVYEV